MPDTSAPTIQTPSSEIPSRALTLEPAERGPNASAGAGPAVGRFSFVAGTDTSGVCEIEGECR
ncbi:hypothetical protein [Microlunatus endophyticus]|uniref:hypothetical protein n=1 Tax=Microlunatus endophyticus TaxID=1716077 RepID=UPI0016664C2A|nr:hypothetical protein [Microlunatus endophyticus]